MASRIAIVGLALILVVVSAYAEGPPATTTAPSAGDSKSTPVAAGDGKAATTADSKAPAGAPTLDDDKPRALTPFANSPEMSASLADGPSNQIDDEDMNNDALLGSPTPAKDYGERDPDPTASSSPVGVSSAAAVSVAAAAASSYLFF